MYKSYNNDYVYYLENKLERYDNHLIRRFAELHKCYDRLDMILSLIEEYKLTEEYQSNKHLEINNLIDTIMEYL